MNVDPNRPDRAAYQASREFSWQPYRQRPLSVWAMRMNHDFEIKTLEGKLEGHAGDWLIRADDGQQFPVPDTVFRRYFVSREWKGDNHENEKNETQNVVQKHDANGAKPGDRQEVSSRIR
jgi:hypothetical protein